MFEMGMYGDDDLIAFEPVCEIISLLYVLTDSFTLRTLKKVMEFQNQLTMIFISAFNDRFIDGIVVCSSSSIAFYSFAVLFT